MQEWHCFRAQLTEIWPSPSIMAVNVYTLAANMPPEPTALSCETCTAMCIPSLYYLIALYSRVCQVLVSTAYDAGTYLHYDRLKYYTTTTGCIPYAVSAYCSELQNI